MWSVQRPAISTSDAYLTVARATKKVELRGRYVAAEPAVVSAATVFEAAVASGATHGLDPADFKVPRVTDGEMVDLYDLRLVDTERGRAIYEAIKAAPEYGRCPLCGQQPVTTLDHHLPKAVFAALTVVPTNLVPACKDCNHAKGHAVGGSPADEPIHPYFDIPDDDPWLTAVVLERTPPALLFSVTPPSEWPSSLVSRVEKHFERFGLDAMYGALAATELSNIKGDLRRVLQSGGPSEGPAMVRLRLEEAAESRREARVNSWQTAMYTAVAANPWYYSGGFLN
ncbi:HNH endonuclease [Blastococcus sp. LR1]|uniref:HNH endonuclease n=1 Tax=Blastococcus sp. LR1 TaxID=2877000 RepID=UPI001CCB5D97|nr:HNH endonuclease [Blastococcus sp. LR1]MCA0146661.1 HNH endonuclease [Blastococcus sp. LR1]